MKKFIVITTLAAALILNIYSANAQTSYPTYELTYHTINDCMVYVDTWYIDEETGLPAQEDNVFASSIYTTVMPDSFLYNVQVTASVHFHQDYTGPVTLLIDKQAWTANGDESALYHTMDFVEGSWLAEQEATFTFTFIMAISGIRSMPGIYTASKIDVELFETINANLRIDMVRVKKSPGNSCFVH